MNLLPTQHKEILLRDVFLRFLSIAGLIVVFWVFLFFAIISNIIFYLNIQIPALEARLQQERGTETTQVLQEAEEEIITLNSMLVRIQKVRDKSTFDFAKALRDLGALTPDGVTLRALTFQQNESAAIIGHAETREQAVLFKDALEQNKFCAELRSPLLVKETDVSFTFSCVIYNER